MPKGIFSPGGWALWQGCVRRLLGDILTGYGVYSRTCRRSAGWWGSITIPCVLCVLSPTPIHCLHHSHIITKLKERLLEEVFPFQLGWPQYFVRETFSIHPTPSPLWDLLVYMVAGGSSLPRCGITCAKEDHKKLKHLLIQLWELFQQW